MDKEDYSSRMMAVLDEDKYNTLKRDPTVKVERNTSNTLKRLHNKGHIVDKQCDLLTPRYSPTLDVWPPKGAQGRYTHETHCIDHWIPDVRTDLPRN